MTVSKLSKGRMSLLVAMATLLVVALACGKEATPAPTPTAALVATPASAKAPTSVGGPVGKVVLATSDWGNELFSDRDTSGEAMVYMKQLHDALIGAKGGKALAPGVAKSWSLTPDGKTWTFEIRDGIKFHNGTKLTAEDVAFSLVETIHKEHFASDVGNIAASIVEPFRVTGPNTVSVTTKEPLVFLGASYLSDMQTGATGFVFSKAYRESVGRAGYNANPSPGGSGPFVLLKHDKGSLMRFERFDDYWDIAERNHRFRTLEMRLIPELSTRVAALGTGAADIIESNLEVRDQIVAAGGKVIFAPEAVYLWVVSKGSFLPETVIPWKKEIRQALDYAIDKELIARELYGSEVANVAGWAYVSPSSLGYEPDLDSWPYDPEKGRQLLAKADCANAKCFPDPYILYTWQTGELPFLPETTQLICGMWKKNLGVPCVVEVGDSTAVRAKLNGNKLPGNYVVRVNEDRFDGGSITFGSYAGSEASAIRDPELRSIVEKAVGTIGTQEERHRAYHDMYVRLREEHAEFSILTANTPWGVSKKIKEWKPWPLVPYASALWTIELAE